MHSRRSAERLFPLICHSFFRLFRSLFASQLACLKHIPTPIFPCLCSC